jgi:hypothetical protein
MPVDYHTGHVLHPVVAMKTRELTSLLLELDRLPRNSPFLATALIQVVHATSTLKVPTRLDHVVVRVESGSRS